MRIFIKAKPLSSKDSVVKIDETHFEVFVKAPPIKGLANLVIVKLLADFFELPKSKVKIISGFRQRQKNYRN